MLWGRGGVLCLQDAYMNPYTVLGIPNSATKDEAKQAYRKLCLRCHPDLSPPNERAAAEIKFRQLTEAYNSVSGTGRQYRNYSRSHSGATRHYAWPSPSTGGSNGLLAAIICAPLVLLGVHVALVYHKMPAETWRPRGLFYPPENPYLKDELRAREFSHRGRSFLDRWRAARQAASAENIPRTPSSEGQ